MSGALFHLVMAAISLVIAYCCLWMAGKWDRISEEDYKNYSEMNDKQEDL